MRNIFPDHPYSRDMLGSESSVSKISRQSLFDYWHQVRKAKNVTVVLSGNFDKDLWLEKLEKGLAPLPQGQKITNTYPVKPLTDDVVCFEATKKEQSHVVYGFRGLSITDDDRYTLQIIQSILAGQGGRLFLELRDKNSLAYSVSPMRMEGIETGYFGAYIGCSPEKVTKAVSMMKEQFALLCQHKVEEGELNRARRYVVGRHDIDLQQTSAVASAILYNDIYGVDFNEPFTCADKYFAVTAQHVQELSRKIFSQKSVISVVGPNNPF